MSGETRKMPPKTALVTVRGVEYKLNPKEVLLLSYNQLLKDSFNPNTAITVVYYENSIKITCHESSFSLKKCAIEFTHFNDIEISSSGTTPTFVVRNIFDTFCQIDVKVDFCKVSDLIKQAEEILEEFNIHMRDPPPRELIRQSTVNVVLDSWQILKCSIKNMTREAERVKLSTKTTEDEKLKLLRLERRIMELYPKFIDCMETAPYEELNSEQRAALSRAKHLEREKEDSTWEKFTLRSEQSAKSIIERYMTSHKGKSFLTVQYLEKDVSPHDVVYIWELQSTGFMLQKVFNSAKVRQEGNLIKLPGRFNSISRSKQIKVSCEQITIPETTLFIMNEREECTGDSPQDIVCAPGSTSVSIYGPLKEKLVITVHNPQNPECALAVHDSIHTWTSGDALTANIATLQTEEDNSTLQADRVMPTSEEGTSAETKPGGSRKRRRITFQPPGL